MRYLLPHITGLLLQVMLKFLKQRKILCKVTSQTLFDFFTLCDSLASMFIAAFPSVGEETVLTCCFSLDLKSLLFLTSLNYIEILLNVCFQGTKKQILQDRERY